MERTKEFRNLSYLPDMGNCLSGEVSPDNSNALQEFIATQIEKSFNQLVEKRLESIATEVHGLGDQLAQIQAHVVQLADGANQGLNSIHFKSSQKSQNQI